MKPNIKTLALLAAAAIMAQSAGAVEIVTAGYDDITFEQEWKSEAVPKSTATGALPFSDYRQGFGQDNKFYIQNKNSNGKQIEVYDQNGFVKVFAASSNGSNFTKDEAGNMLVRLRQYISTYSSRSAEIRLIKADGSQTADITLTSEVPGARGDYWGFAEGDVFSAEGGKLMMTAANITYVYVIEFKNGALSSAYRVPLDFNIGGSSLSLSSTDVANAWTDAKGTKHFLLNQATGYAYDLVLNGTTATVTEINLRSFNRFGTCVGYNAFAMNGKNYVMFSTQPNWNDGFVIAEIPTDDNGNITSNPVVVVAEHVNDYTEPMSTNVSPKCDWLNVEPRDSKSVYVYQYFPGYYMARYIFGEVTDTPLETIVNDGTVGESYTVADDIIGVYVAVKDPTRVYAKDLGKHRYPSTIGASQVDYVRGVARLQAKDWDQSNWVLLDMGNANDAEALIGKVIEGGTLTGTLTDKLNPTMIVTDWKQPTEEQAYDVNNYVTCNFMTPNVQAGNDGKNYFFVEPKAQEYAMVNWATYRGNDHFSVFRTTETGETFGNQSGLAGEFDVDWSLYPGNYLEDFVVNTTYNFHAIVRYIPAEEPGSSAPRRAAAQGRYMVFPLEGGAGIVTAVDTPHADRTVASVTYVDALGRVARTPHAGVNIVVTRYTDGTQSVAKNIK